MSFTFFRLISDLIGESLTKQQYLWPWIKSACSLASRGGVRFAHRLRVHYEERIMDEGDWERSDKTPSEAREHDEEPPRVIRRGWGTKPSGYEWWWRATTPNGCERSEPHMNDGHSWGTKEWTSFTPSLAPKECRRHLRSKPTELAQALRNEGLSVNPGGRSPTRRRSLPWPRGSLPADRTKAKERSDWFCEAECTAKLSRGA